tara:strand:+ start:3786 stop:5756 length:1971 start_codon:yes stop_codon:yes gene_type:complete
MNKIIYFIDAYKPKIPQRYSYFYNLIMNKLFYANIKKNIRNIKKLSRKYNVIVYSLDQSSDKILSELNIEYKIKFKDSVQTLKDVPYSKKTSLNFTRQNITNNPILSKSLNYNGISLLDVNELDIWNGYSDILIKNIDLINSIIKKENPKFIVSASKSVVSKIIKKLCLLNKIKFSRNSLFILNTFNKLFNLILPLGIYFVKPAFEVKISNTNMKNKNKKDKVIFFIELYNESRAKEFLRVYHNLNKKFDFIIIGLNDIGKKVFKSEGLKFKCISNYITKDIIKKYIHSKKSYKNQYSMFNKNIKKCCKYNVKYKGINILKHISHVFKYLYLNKFSEIVLYNEIIKKIYEIEKPDAILLTEYTKRFCKTIAKTSKLLNVPSITIQHGIMEEMPELLPIVPDYFFAFGGKFKNILLKSNLNFTTINKERNNAKPNTISEKIKIVGIQRYDEILSKKYNNKKVYSDFKINNDEKIVLFITQPFETSYNEELFIMVFKALKQIENNNKNIKIKTIIKLHPNEDGVLHKKIASKLGLKIKIVKNYDLLNLIQASDIVMLVSSTIILDAIIMGKPVISTTLKNKTLSNLIPHEAYMPKGIIHKASSSKELHETIIKLLSQKYKINKLQNSKLKSIYYKLDGKSCDRISNNVKKIIKISKKN